MKNPRLWIITFLASWLFLGCGASSSNNANNKKADVKNQISSIMQSNRYPLLFFVNYRGAPCKFQIQILNAIKERVKEKAGYVFIDVDNPANRQYFYHYSVRGIPLLILLDKNGEVLHRFSPGIIPKKQLIQVLENF